MNKLLPLLLLFFALFNGCKDSQSGEEKVGERVENREGATLLDADTSTPSTTGGEIRVDLPKAGDVLSPSSFQIKGTARTFENTVLYRLVFDSVLVLASGFTTADASEVGKFGSFSVQVDLSSDFSGDAFLEVFEESP
ncbi:MAG: Gmad2 immunoglobulin-like domain-containing protein, partial [Candidatus Kapaibacterium sp.]